MATVHDSSRSPQPSSRAPSTRYGSRAEVSATNQKFVYSRELNRCWLCGYDIGCDLQVAHHLATSDCESFMTFKTRGTINPNVTHLGHPGNLILLCARCHGSYSAPIPRWLIVPANEVLQQMIDQEDRDYAYREAQALKGVAIRRTLLQLDAKAVTYNAFILHEAIYRHMGQAYFNSACPRFYHGDVSAVFHRALTGAFHPWGTYDIQVYGSTVSVGVPASTQSLLSELAIKYGRKDPDVKLPLSVVLRHPPDKGSSQDQTSPDSTDASQSPNNGDDDMAGPSNGGGGGEFEAQYFEKSEVSSMATAFSAPSERRTSMEIQRFVFGPEFSANDIVKQAMGLYSRPKTPS